MEKLLLLSSRLNISLDSLLSVELAEDSAARPNPVTGAITISSPNENVILTCSKVVSTQRIKGGKRSPQYGLFGVGSNGNAFWGEPTTFLAWYADQESLSKEIEEIQRAIMHGKQTYELKYSVKVQRRWMRITMVEDS